VRQLSAAVLELTPDAVVIADSLGRLRLVNRQTEVLFGYARKDLLGTSVERLIPDRFHPAHRAHRALYGAAPHTRPMDTNRALYGRRRDGSEFPAAVSLSPLVDGDETFVVATTRDTGALQQMQDARRAVETANAEFRRLQALTDTALAHLELGDLLPTLLPRIRDVMQAEHVIILLLEADGQTLTVRAEVHATDDASSWQHVPVGVGIVGRIAAGRRPLVVEDLSKHPLVRPHLHQSLCSAVGVPLVAGEQLLGVLCIGSPQERRFSPQDVALLEQAAARIAAAIERARMFAAEQAARQEAERERIQWLTAMDCAP
jgi:PAS domain S-box-containing protein